MRVGAGRVGVIVPVKAFTRAKQRLAGVLSERERAAVARWCATRVVAAAAPLPVHVVCDDDIVAAWATGVGAEVVWCPGVGLNPAIEGGVAALRDRGFDVALVAHGDLPLARRLDHVPLDGHTVAVVPDARFDGTNVLALPTALADGFRFQYGRRSLLRHVREGLRHGAPVRVLRDHDLGHDLDTPDDLDHPLMEELRAWLRTNPANPR